MSDPPRSTRTSADAAGDDFSAKDFRTWSATVLGAVELAKVAENAPRSQSAHKRAVRSAIRVVSEYLGNTPAVCRKSYVDPTVIDRFDHGQTIAPVLEELGSAGDPSDPGVRQAVESAVIDLIVGEPEDTSAVAAAVA